MLSNVVLQHNPTFLPYDVVKGIQCKLFDTAVTDVSKSNKREAMPSGQLATGSRAGEVPVCSGAAT